MPLWQKWHKQTLKTGWPEKGCRKTLLTVCFFTYNYSPLFTLQFFQPVSHLDFLVIKNNKYINKSNQQWATGLPTFAKKRPTFATV
ncbi:hypothetical protein GE757_22160 [Salmonella enterica]|nr:hypothetical protein [Salmonella enterica]